MSNLLVSLEKAFEMELLDSFLKSEKFKKFELKSKIPIDLPCVICKNTRNNRKSKNFCSIYQLFKHIENCHQHDEIRTPTKEEYLNFLYSLSVILESLKNSVGSDYKILVKSFQHMIRKEWIR